MTSAQRDLLVNPFSWIGKVRILGAGLGVLFGVVSLGVGLSLLGVGMVAFLLALPLIRGVP
jgi:hypothetical protein